LVATRRGSPAHGTAPRPPRANAPRCSHSAHDRPTASYKYKSPPHPPPLVQFSPPPPIPFLRYWSVLSWQASKWNYGVGLHAAASAQCSTTALVIFFKNSSEWSATLLHKQQQQKCRTAEGLHACSKFARDTATQVTVHSKFGGKNRILKNSVLGFACNMDQRPA
jgi:hypothetical protein